MKTFLRLLLMASVLVILRAVYGFYLAFAAWDVDGAMGSIGGLKFGESPSIKTNFEKWSAYLLVSVLSFLVLWMLYRRESRPELGGK